MAPSGAVRTIPIRVCRWRDPKIVLRWATTAFLDAEKNFRRIQGYRDLSVLAVALGRGKSTAQVDPQAKAA